MGLLQRDLQLLGQYVAVCYEFLLRHNREPHNKQPNYKQPRVILPSGVALPCAAVGLCYYSQTNRLCPSNKTSFPYFGTVLKCGAGEVSRRSVGPIVWEIKNCCRHSWNIIQTIKSMKDNWIGRALRRDRFLKHVIEGTETEKDRSDGKTMTKA
jgi:hypothetical protein